MNIIKELKSGKIQRQIDLILYPEKFSEKELEIVDSMGKKRRERLSYMKERFLLEPQRKVLEGFYLEKRTNNVSNISCLDNLKVMNRVGHFLNKPFKEITAEDIKKYLATRVDSVNSLTYKKDTIIIKSFFKWLDKPEVINWIKINNREKVDYTDKEILTTSEIKRMVDVADNSRDKAIIMILYDTNFRVGELEGVTLKDIEYDKDGNITIKFEGKTGKGKRQLLESTAHLKTWLNNHPQKNNPDAPLFVALSRKKGMPLAHGGFYDVICKTAKKAGITKNVYPHLLRHSRLTELEEELSGEEFRIRGDWQKGSPMPSTYTHKTEGFVNKKLAIKRGFMKETKEDTIKKEILKPFVCRKCGENNEMENIFCLKCGFPKNVGIGFRFLEKKSKFNEKLQGLGAEYLQILNSPSDRAQILLNKLIEEVKRQGHFTDEELNDLYEKSVLDEENWKVASEVIKKESEKDKTTGDKSMIVEDSGVIIK